MINISGLLLTYFPNPIPLRSCESLLLSPRFIRGFQVLVEQIKIFCFIVKNAVLRVFV